MAAYNTFKEQLERWQALHEHLLELCEQRNVLPPGPEREQTNVLIQQDFINAHEAYEKCASLLNVITEESIGQSNELVINAEQGSKGRLIMMITVLVVGLFSAVTLAVILSIIIVRPLRFSA